MKSWQFNRLVREYKRDNINPLRLYVGEGKHKGKYGTYDYSHSSEIYILLDGATENIKLHYTKLEELDEFGDPRVLPVVDMTGREITLDSYVCYSVNDGQSHALEIGKVYELTRVGQLKVRTVVKNGDKVEPTYYRRNETVVNNPLRSIKLPVDTPELLMWMLQDFEELAQQKK